MVEGAEQLLKVYSAGKKVFVVKMVHVQKGDLK